jgi:hypothetical protein
VNISRSIKSSRHSLVEFGVLQLHAIGGLTELLAAIGEDQLDTLARQVLGRDAPLGSQLTQPSESIAAQVNRDG